MYLCLCVFMRVYLYLCTCIVCVIQCVFVSQCVLLWESAWVALSPQLVHLAECHTATHAPTREQALSLVESFDQSQAACPDGHRDNRETETCMEWCVAKLYTAWGMSRGWRLDGRNCFRVVATPAPNMGGG